MRKLLNTEGADAFKLRLVDGGMSDVSLFYRELMSREAMRGRPRAALTIDVHAVYSKWCDCLGLRPLTLPRFVHELQKRHGVVSERRRYELGGKSYGPHGLLILQGQDVSLGEQIADFHRFAMGFRDGAPE